MTLSEIEKRFELNLCREARRLQLAIVDRSVTELHRATTRDEAHRILERITGGQITKLDQDLVLERTKEARRKLGLDSK